MILFKVEVFLSVLSFVYTFDRSILISNLHGCREILLEDEEVNDVFEISKLLNNYARYDEVLRMKFFVLGHDMHVRLSESNDFNSMHYLIYFHGSGGGDTYKTALARTDNLYNSWYVLEEAYETVHTDRFYYTMLHIIVKKGI